MEIPHTPPPREKTLKKQQLQILELMENIKDQDAWRCMISNTFCDKYLCDKYLCDKYLYDN